LGRAVNGPGATVGDPPVRFGAFQRYIKQEPARGSDKGDAMHTVTTMKGLEVPRLANLHVRSNDDFRSLRLARENASLMLDNTRLRVEYENLLSSTETWIRLYEAALERANAAVRECGLLREQGSGT
jgi:hypothetical protein